MRTRKARPATAVRLRTNWRVAMRSAWPLSGLPSSAANSGVFIDIASIPDAWIEQRIHHVGGDVRSDKEHGNHQSYALHNGKVTVDHRVEHSRAEPGYCEDVFDRNLRS